MDLWSIPPILWKHNKTVHLQANHIEYNIVQY